MVGIKILYKSKNLALEYMGYRNVLQGKREKQCRVNGEKVMKKGIRGNVKKDIGEKKISE